MYCCSLVTYCISSIYTGTITCILVDAEIFRPVYIFRLYFIVKYIVNVLCKFYQWSFSYSKLIYTFSGWSEPILAVEQVSSNYF